MIPSLYSLNPIEFEEADRQIGGHMNMIQTFVQQAIREHPEVAIKEVPEIIETYAIDNTKLNRVKDAAKIVCESPTMTTLAALAWAIRDAEGVPE